MRFIKSIICCLVGSAVCLSSVPTVHAAHLASSLAGPASGEIIIQYRDSTTLPERAALKAANGLEARRGLPFVQAELVQASSPEAAAAAMQRLQKDPRVRSVQPNHRYRTATADTYYGELWGLENAGQTISGYPGVADVDIDASDAWQLTRGSRDVVVAVIDTGVDISHPDLAANVWRNPLEVAGDGKDNDHNGYADDVNGWDFLRDTPAVYSAADKDQHGTHVSGTIAAAADNGRGIAGVAPNVRIMPLKVIGPASGSTADAIEAIAYAQSMGADLINASWSGDAYDNLLRQAIEKFGKPFVAAAGNVNRNLEVQPEYPAAFDCANIITVAAIDNRGGRATYSNYGAAAVDLGAPGSLILSTNPASSYAWMSGTSMATPHVSGIAALMLSINPALTSAEIRQALIDAVTPMPSLAGQCVSGGLANAGRAVTAAAASLGQYWVHFDSQGGSAIPSSQAAAYGLAACPASPSRTGFTFAGWFKEAACQVPWRFDMDRVTAETTLYAGWTAVQANPGAGQFVTRLYQTCLNRSPDAGGLEYWTSALLGRHLSGADVAARFILSDEFVNRQLADADYISILYRAFFDREPDADGIAFWSSALQRGMSRYYVFSGFVNSDEFRALSAVYGIDAGTAPLVAPADRYPDLTAFVTRFYTLCLERRPDSDGLNYWVDALARQALAGADVADRFISSPEFTGRMVDDGTFLTIMYQAFFDREADAGGREYWLRRLADGLPRRTVLACFVNSVEFQDICARFGIARGAIVL